MLVKFISSFFAVWIFSAVSFVLISPLRAIELPHPSKERQKLVLVKAVDSEKRSFIVNIGYSDGVSNGLESLFTTKDFTIRAQAVEVSRFASLWRIDNQQARIPFSQNEYVIFNFHLENILTDLQRHVLLEQELMAREKDLWRLENYWTARLSLSRGLYESITETTAEQDTTRGGFQGELSYYIPSFLPIVDYGLGVRFDQEKVVLSSPSLEIPTQRLFLMNELTYNFSTLPGGNFFYLSAGAGAGLSRTNVDGDINQGTVWILPSVRLGHALVSKRERAYLFEIAAESLSAKEKTRFGVQQTTTIINAKIGLGVRF